jgi:hypothetical protein
MRRLAARHVDLDLYHQGFGTCGFEAVEGYLVVGLSV